MNNSIFLKDLADGIIVLDDMGTIIEANPSAIKLLGLTDDYLGKKYINIISASERKENDEFHQIVIDSILSAPETCKRRVKYLTANGEVRIFQLSSSVSEKGDESGRLILTFTDITETTRLTMLRGRASYAFIVILGFLSCWILAYALWQYLGNPIPVEIMSKILILSCLIVSVFTVLYLKLKPEECGLKYKGIKKVIITDILIAMVGAAALIIVKIIIMRAAPNFNFYCKDNRFFDISKYKWYNYLWYAFSVLAQEFGSRGLIHEQTRIVISSKHREPLAILMSSLVFAAAHVHLGLIYMICAGLLLGLLGVVYKKQGTIWGLCIPHFVLGEMIGILGFVAF